MKSPASTLVVDSAILLAAVLEDRDQVLLQVATSRDLLLTERTIAECSRRLELGMKRPDLLPRFSEITDAIGRVNLLELAMLLDPARSTLANSIPGGSGSTNDAHVLACAWRANADIWSFDRDFAGTGVASWSTANLLRALALET